MAATDAKPRGGKPDKIVRDALKAALRQDPEALKRIAEKWVKRAEEDQMAANALTDRLDGKAVQPIVGDDEHPPIEASLKVEWVSGGDDKAAT